MMNIPVVCYGCDNRFTTMRVTASLKCARCGSDDLDLDTLITTSASGGTGWNQPRPDRLEGWAVQPPVNLPGPNPQASTRNVAEENAGGSMTCQACGGTGIDTRASGGGYNEVPCRNCHGTGVEGTHATTPGAPHDLHAGPEVGGARYPFTSGRRSSDPMGSADDYIRGTDPDYDNRSAEPRKADTRSPMVKTRQQRDYTHGNSALSITAPCPECGSHKTQIARDAKDDAWWHCPKCGPLANVDANPEINPFDPPEDFEPNRRMKTKVARFRKTEKTGKVLKMTRAVLDNNPGLSSGQALTLVRNALLKYPEGQ